MNALRPKNVICILGMHRSGTSCLTGSLQKSGLELGKHHTYNPFNKRGNRENQDIVDLHEQILADNGGAWDNPPKRVVWQPHHVDIAKKILASYAGLPVWGFKDPRSLLCLQGWKTLLPDMRYIGIFRHPDSVVASLDSRIPIARERALELWRHYNGLLLNEYKQKSFPVLCFDLDEAQFHHQFDRMVTSLGLAPSSNDKFYTNTLHTHRNMQAGQLPWKIRLMYHRLKKLNRRSFR